MFLFGKQQTADHFLRCFSCWRLYHLSSRWSVWWIHKYEGGTKVIWSWSHFNIMAEKRFSKGLGLSSDCISSLLLCQGLNIPKWQQSFPKQGLSAFEICSRRQSPRAFSSFGHFIPEPERSLLSWAGSTACSVCVVFSVEYVFFHQRCKCMLGLYGSINALYTTARCRHSSFLPCIFSLSALSQLSKFPNNGVYRSWKRSVLIRRLLWRYTPAFWEGVCYGWGKLQVTCKQKLVVPALDRVSGNSCCQLATNCELNHVYLYISFPCLRQR